MSCDYPNIEELCLNKYSYIYVSNSGDSDSVYRIDKETGSKTLISLNNNLETILPCDPNSEEDIITAWRCYEIWKEAGNIPVLANIDELKNQKKTQLLAQYNDILAKNYTTMVGVDVDLSLESRLDFVSTISNVKVETPIIQPVIFTGTATATYSAGPEYNYTPGGLVPTSIQTIRVPDIITLPADVTFDGGCDDGLAINGVRISSFAQIPPPFVITERTFEAGTWNDGGPWVCGGTFTFRTQATGSNNFVAGIEQTTARPTNNNIVSTSLPNDEWNNILVNYSSYLNNIEAEKNRILQKIDKAVSIEELDNILWNNQITETPNIIIEAVRDVMVCNDILTIEFDDMGRTGTESPHFINLFWSIENPGNPTGNVFCGADSFGYTSVIGSRRADVRIGQAFCDNQFQQTDQLGRKYTTVRIYAHWGTTYYNGENITVTASLAGTSKSIEAPRSWDGLKCSSQLFGYVYVFEDTTFVFCRGDQEVCLGRP